jgi:hypothetical protein
MVADNKLAYVFIVFGVLVLFAIGISSAQQNPGHPISQIDPPLSGTCSAGKFIKYIGGANVYECGDEVGLGDITSILVAGGSGLTLPSGGASGDVTLGTDFGVLQRRVTGNCNGQVMVSIDADGTVNCEADDAGGGVTSSAGSHYIPKIDFPDSNNLVDSTIYEANGNIGIGTTGPGHKLEIYDASVQDPGSDAHINLIGYQTSPPGPRSMYIGRAGSYGYIQMHNSQPLALNPLGNNVGIGESSPTATLHVDGTIRFEDFLSCSALETNANGDLVCGTDDVGSGGVTGSGSVNTLAMFSGSTSNIGNSKISQDGSGNVIVQL